MIRLETIDDYERELKFLYRLAKQGNRLAHAKGVCVMSIVEYSLTDEDRDIANHALQLIATELPEDATLTSNTIRTIAIGNLIPVLLAVGNGVTREGFLNAMSSVYDAIYALTHRGGQG